MFCNQCEQTARGICCDKSGVCGKKPEVAAIQDLLVYASRGLAVAACSAGQDEAMRAGRLCTRALFSTVTNVNFDMDPLIGLLDEVVEMRDAILKNRPQWNKALPVLAFIPAKDEQALLEQAEEVACINRLHPDSSCNSLAQTLLFGLKGLSAYADHAAILNHESEELYRNLFDALSYGFDERPTDLTGWLTKTLDCGHINLKAMELLDAANTSTYGHPEPTEVALRPRPGKAILVTGHDLKDLYNLLVQTEGKGINIYTHGEMLPCHAYPGLKKFSHLAGHFGTAWQNQQKEFPLFPGAILFTTNCIQRPADSYADNVFTTGLVGWPGIKHVQNGDFGPVIEQALALPGFSVEAAGQFPDKRVLVGFARNAVLGVAGQVIDAVKAGKIRHFFLVGGCDGAKPGRNYYTELVEKAPADTVILTLACGKFRFFDKQLGDIGGIPRLLDVGQCNDAYSAIQIALALANAFECEVNELPLSLILSWYEQKAVAILLTLLALGIKNIRIGPSLPAFTTPEVLNVLVKEFGLAPISTPDEDLKQILG